MSKPFVIAFGGAILAILAIAGYISFSQRGNRIVPTGRILHVRSVPVDPLSAALIVDFEIANTADVEMIIRFITLALHKHDGSLAEGSLIAASDLPVLFRYHRDELGAMGNPPMRERTRIASHQTLRGSTAVRYDLPDSDLKARRDVQLTLEDVTGAKLELTAK